MLLRENKNNAYAKFGGTNKECYGIFRSGLLYLVQQHLLEMLFACVMSMKFTFRFVP